MTKKLKNSLYQWVCQQQSSLTTNAHTESLYHAQQQPTLSVASPDFPRTLKLDQKGHNSGQKINSLTFVYRLCKMTLVRQIVWSSFPWKSSKRYKQAPRWFCKKKNRTGAEYLQREQKHYASLTAETLRVGASIWHSEFCRGLTAW